MKQRSIRVAMPESMYEKLKLVAPTHGDISKLVRDLLLKYIAAQEPEELCIVCKQSRPCNCQMKPGGYFGTRT